MKYKRTKCVFSYLRVDDDSEIDLIVEKSNSEIFLIEIKSKDHTDERDVNTLQRFFPDFKNAKAICLSNDPTRKKIGDVLALPWQEGITEIFD